MDNWQTILVIVCGLGLVQSIFLGAIQIFKDRLNFGGQFYSGVMLIGLAFRLAKSYFVFVPQKYPHWGVVAGGAGLWMIGPAFFLYTIYSMDPRRKPSLYNLFHFIPAILIVLTGVTDYVYYIGLGHILVYLIVSVRGVAKADVSQVPMHFRIFTVCVGFILLCFTVQAVVGGIEIYTVGTAMAITALYLVNYFMLKESDFFVSIIKKPKDISRAISSDIISEIDSVFIEMKTYRKKGLTISEVAKQINRPAYLISQSINQQHGIRFNEFVNRYRVHEAMDKLKSDNDKIEIIAKEVGFSSLSSLYEAFKKEINLTPQGYRKQFSNVRSISSK